MSINIDDREVKQILKDGLSVKESDFKTPMKMVNNIQPCFLLNNVPKMLYTESEAIVIVQNVWSTFFDIQESCKIYMIKCTQSNANEDMEYRITWFDGTTTTLTQAGAVAGTGYYIYLTSTGLALTTTASSYIASGGMELRSFKLEARKTTAAGANNQTIIMSYQTW